MGQLIKYTGETENFEIRADDPEWGSRVRAAVGGYVEAVYLTHSRVMLIDEDGKLKDKPLNIKATKMAQEVGAIVPGTTIVGDVVVLDLGKEID